MSSVSDFSFATLEAPADLAVTAAQREREARDVLAAAHAEADAIRAQAHAEGLALGRQEALAAAGPAAEALGEAARQLSAEAGELAERTERAAVELALRIAEQALGAALEVQPERVLDVVRGALRRLVERERVLLLVHPDDLDLVRARLDTVTGSLGGIEHCEVQAERRVPRGGAIVRTGEGDVDATMATKLVRAREALEHELAADRA
ncbi:MAG TPA: FliH/SctL family protein [Capillimicrobium sp.]|jgi:flagellar biosynthesis/type III secretory pathway protein FliH